MTEEDLEAVIAANAQAEDARPLIREDFPVGAAPRAQWAKARAEMADATPALLAHIAALRDALTSFAYRDDLGPVLLRERSNARELLESGVYRPMLRK